jgi:single-strand DNA-binding protein
VAIFNEHLGGVALERLKKGSRVYVEGRLQYRKFTDGDGVERILPSIVLQKFTGKLIVLYST